MQTDGVHAIPQPGKHLGATNATEYKNLESCLGLWEGKYRGGGASPPPPPPVKLCDQWDCSFLKKSFAHALLTLSHNG